MQSTRPFWFPDIKAFIAIILVLAVVSMAFVLIFRPNTMDNDMLKMVAGALLMSFGTIVQFFFGSSTEGQGRPAVPPVPVADKPAA
jgi:lipopolysaccharide export LptBFGC system permease protein LptF